MARKWNTVKVGEAVMLDGEVWLVVSKHMQTRGNWRSYYQVQLKNHERGNVRTNRYSPDDVVEEANLFRKEQEFLYRDGDMLVFMDPETYEQITTNLDVTTPEKLKFLPPNCRVTLVTLDDKPVGIELPLTVEMEVTEAYEAARGDTATSVTKRVKIETGAEVSVPAHINQGDRIKIRTENGEFVGRV